MLGVSHMLSHFVLTEILKVGAMSHTLQRRLRKSLKKKKNRSSVYQAGKRQSRNFSPVHLSSCAVTPSSLSGRWDCQPALFCSVPGLSQRPSPLPECSPGERKEFCPVRARLVLSLPLCSVSMLMGLDCASLQLLVPWDRSYRWNHSNLTFGNIGQFPLLWTPSLTSNIAWSTWAVSQSLKGFFVIHTSLL